MDQPHLPFQLAEVYGGFARIDGIMIVAEKHIEFEYQTSDNVLGAVRGKTQKRKLRYADISEVHSKEGWFSCWIEFQARTLKAFADFPQKDRKIFRITVEKKRRPAMRTALSEIEVRRSYLDADRLLKKQRRRKPVKKSRLQ